MAVYVDDMYLSSLGRYGRMKMSHIIADSTEELLTMMKRIGVQEKWIQDRGTYSEHFDIAKGKRELAIRYGAIPITLRQCAAMIDQRREMGPDYPLFIPRL